jgi:hypothetical protein
LLRDQRLQFSYADLRITFERKLLGFLQRQGWARGMGRQGVGGLRRLGDALLRWRWLRRGNRLWWLDLRVCADAAKNCDRDG